MQLADERHRDPGPQALWTNRAPHPFLNTGAIDLAAVALSAIRIHRRTIDSRKVNLIQDLPERMMADVPMLAGLQVVSNVIAHSLAALPCYGTLSLRLRGRQDRVHLLVSDNGLGRSATMLQSIFLPYRGEGDERGSGVGLALSKTIVERYRGAICVRSSICSGRAGTTFRISLPHSGKDALLVNGVQPGVYKEPGCGVRL